MKYRVVSTLLLIVGAIIFLFPFYFMLMGSFKTNSEIFSMKILRLPENGFRLTYYIGLFVMSKFGRSLLNSTIVSIAFITLIIFFSSLAGFAFAKYKFPGRNILFVFLLATIMLPPQVTSFSIFLMRQYISYVPAEILNSARVDGCREFRIYWDIVLPMVKSGLLVVGMIVFMDIWNDFMWPLISVSRLEMYTVSLNIARLFGTQREVEWGQIMAGCFMSSLPLIVIFLVFRKTFISGITSGALKS
jgi:ABC-type glycerol-3-phosphate transport system permease component